MFKFKIFKIDVNTSNHMRNMYVLIINSCLLYLVGCSHASKQLQNYTVKELRLKEPIQLSVNGVKGHKEETLNYSKSITKTYENSQITHEKHETVEFTTRSTTLDAKENEITIAVETIEKDGQVNLHEMAFPELEETIVFVYDSLGKVISAGNYPKKSIFYVPSIPLTDKPVQVGETWNFRAQWMSQGQAIPFEVELVVIFRNFYSCMKGLRCAKLVFSGGVEMPEALKKKMDFTSQIEGELVYVLETATVLWSEIYNRETLKISETEVRVQACTASALKNKKIQSISCEL